MDTGTEASRANAQSELPNELLDESPKADIQVNQVVNLSESPNKLLNDEPVNDTQDGVDNFGESLTAAQLALLIGVGDRAVTIAASQGHEYFKGWSAKKGEGTWDFQILNPGAKKLREGFLN